MHRHTHARTRTRNTPGQLGSGHVQQLRPQRSPRGRKEQPAPEEARFRGTSPPRACQRGNWGESRGETAGKRRSPPRPQLETPAPAGPGAACHVSGPALTCGRGARPPARPAVPHRVVDVQRVSQGGGLGARLGGLHLRAHSGSQGSCGTPGGVPARPLPVLPSRPSAQRLTRVSTCRVCGGLSVSDPSSALHAVPLSSSSSSGRTGARGAMATRTRQGTGPGPAARAAAAGTAVPRVPGPWAGARRGGRGVAWRLLLPPPRPTSRGWGARS